MVIIIILEQIKIIPFTNTNYNKIYSIKMFSLHILIKAKMDSLETINAIIYHHLKCHII